MKKAILIVLLALFSAVCSAGDKGPLKFLGIPIDGTEAVFVANLRTKGFTYNLATGGYKGQFNGRDVDVFIHTNHDKVDRVYVDFPFTDEYGIKLEFNHLLRQFDDNVKYLDLVMNEPIPGNEDISYEINVNNKRYQALFSYFDENRDYVALINALFDKLSDFFTEEQLAQMKENTVKAMNAPKDQQEAICKELLARVHAMGNGQESNSKADSERNIKYLFALMDGMRSLADGEVWFVINKRYNRYNIGLYYDNLHNQAHGEDL